MSLQGACCGAPQIVTGDFGMFFEPLADFVDNGTCDTFGMSDTGSRAHQGCFDALFQFIGVEVFGWPTTTALYDVGPTRIHLNGPAHIAQDLTDIDEESEHG
jgi:hypothetical protein